MVLMLLVSVIVLVAALLLLSAPIDPVVWTPDPESGLAGDSAASDRSAAAERLPVGVGMGPEDVACEPGVARYTGFQDGRIVRFDEEGNQEEFADITSASECDGSLYLGSLSIPSVTRYPIR